jgi:hypothetical protein
MEAPQGRDVAARGGIFVQEGAGGASLTSAWPLMGEPPGLG